MAVETNIPPPQNIEAEQSVLGAILLESDALLKATDILEPHDFYKESHREILNAVLDLYQLGDEIDSISLTERMNQKGILEKCGGASYLSTLMNVTPTSANIGYHSRIVKDKAVQRRILNWSYNIAKEIHGNEAHDLKKFFGRIEQGLIDLSQSIQEKKSPEVTAIINDLQTRWRNEAEGIISYIPVGIKLEEAIPRYAPGHIWMIGGYTSVGKSTFMADLVVETCEAGSSNLVFSLEDSREEKLIKFTAHKADMSQKRLMMGHTNGHETKISKAFEEIKKWKLFIYDDIYSFDEMRLKIKKHKLQHGVNIVFIDYIQNIFGEGSLYERISSVMPQIQRLAKEMQVTFIILSQINNEAMKANSEIIGLKGAGELSAAADIILWLKRVKGAGKERHLDCELKKNRPFGMTGLFEFTFSEWWSRIEMRAF